MVPSVRSQDKRRKSERWPTLVGSIEYLTLVTGERMASMGMVPTISIAFVNLGGHVAPTEIDLDFRSR